jgi:hypothetical protein
MSPELQKDESRNSGIASGPGLASINLLGRARTPVAPSF